MLISIINFFYIVYTIFPFILLFLKKKYLQKIRDHLKYIFLVYILTPLMWIICNGECIMTILCKYLGYYNDSDNDIRDIHDTGKQHCDFNEKYLKLIYKPIIIIFNMDYNEKNILKLSSVMSFIPIITMYYVSFFRVFE